MGIQNIQAAVLHCVAYSDFFRMIDFFDAYANSCFRRTVLIVDTSACKIFDFLDQLARQSFATANNAFEIANGIGKRFIPQKSIQPRRSRCQEADAIIANQPG